MTELEILKAARALISDIEHWCVANYAEDNCGCIVDATDELAYSFCALGAVQRVCNTIVPDNDIFTKLNHAAVALGYDSGIATLNDDIEDSYEAAHKRVLKAFDLAIKRLERP